MSLFLRRAFFTTILMLVVHTNAYAGSIVCVTADVSTATACDGAYPGLDNVANVNSLQLFGFDDWVFAQSIFSSASTNIDLGLTGTINTSDFASGDWSVANFAGATDVMMVLRPQDFVVGGDFFTGFLLDTSQLNGTFISREPGGSCCFDIDRISIFVRNPSPVPLPLPGILLFSALVGLLPLRRKR